MLNKLFSGADRALAHCDLYCGVYDPAQAKIEALSCLKTINKYHDSADEHFRARCVIVKEERAEEAKHHLEILLRDHPDDPAATSMLRQIEGEPRMPAAALRTGM